MADFSIVEVIESAIRKGKSSGFAMSIEEIQKQFPDATGQEILCAYENTRKVNPRKNEINCPICGNKRYIAKLDEKGNSVIRMCVCHYKNETNRQLAENNMNRTWESYQIEHEWQRETLLKAKEYCKEKDPNRWFYIGGQTGAGKTLICEMIGNELIRSHRAVYKVQWSKFVQTVKSCIMNREMDKFNAYLRRAETYDVLYIDDLLKTHTEADLNYLFQIINYRYENGKQTIISSEHTIDKLTHIDDAIAGRIVQRAGLNRTPCYCINYEKDKERDWRRNH